MLKTDTIQFRISPVIKKKATSIFAKQNVDLSFALQTFLEKVVENDKSFIEIKTENGFLPAFEKKLLSSYKKAKFSKPHKNHEDFMKDLNN